MDASVYRRPEKPLRSSLSITTKHVVLEDVAEIAKPLMIHASTECHVTPEKEGDIMASYLIDMVGTDGLFLEPQCGTGNLIGALLRQGVQAGNVEAVERHYDLQKMTRDTYGIPVHHTCFLEFAETCQTKFNGIISNPPFKKVRKHILASEKLLAPDGILVALVPITFNREGYRDLEELPPDLFPTAKVNTKLVVFQA
ncbi:SAM-dependent methyltransferase [Vibrio parahaemolyticus]|uniref:SAM-dependent methyltransferase n=1 Tax=Vibrio alginolyticus TaxID=663 RepID=A0A7Y4F150_VIBAL|nr:MULTISPECIES: SAM-dependent methyltransferase [Vibrio harveyi group]HAS6253054.1 SAM-dependent methyltransferase [Vibrio vulnificus]AHJ02770.1 hypothetical protein VPUCM_p0093 [Vibrio parahaemolyticus UCM-V493]APX10145.1 SAM-dependent methyltransferase [Vibrio campbellii]EGQ8229596.1 SAM-dependent methyltransferase [Vibrio parahaemolyticus]EGQ8329880.1 SAM-dependent methyltransferase [Vibrio parahaemolyticus]